MIAIEYYAFESTFVAFGDVKAWKPNNSAALLNRNLLPQIEIIFDSRLELCIPYILCFL